MLPLLALVTAAATTPVVVTPASASVAMSALPGLDVSGCEFAANAALCPTAANIDAYADMGFKAVRLPVKSSQLAAAIPKLQPAVTEALKRDMLVVIDLHDFMPLDPARIIPLVEQVSTAFGPDVWIDYDNEPGSPTGTTGDGWVASATATNAIIAAVRKAGVTNTLVAEWPTYSGNYRFASVQTAAQPCGGFACGLDRVGGLQDPLGKTVLGPHRYYDQDKSGTHAACGTTGGYWAPYYLESDRRNLKTLIGETAWGSAAAGVPASCTVAYTQSLKEIAASTSTVAYTVWGGGAAWAAGYIFAIPPTAAAASSAYVQTLTGR